MAAPNGNVLDAGYDQLAKRLLKYTCNFTLFTGISNPRYLRDIQALMKFPISHEHHFHSAGCSYCLELVADIRRRMNQWLSRRERRDTK